MKKFSGSLSFLSNFYPVDVYGYPSVENAYQAVKSLDKEYRLKLRQCSPAEAKRLGRKAALREGWESMKLEVMETLLQRKFSLPHLKEKLLSVDDADLVEENTWHDNFWGVCTCPRCTGGENHLGRLLKKIKKA